MVSRRTLGWSIFGTIVLSLGIYLVGNDRVALFDRDEPRYAECSREMLHGSPEHPGPNWVVPRFLGELRTAKPPLIYWCQAGVMKLTSRETVFSARLPSVIAMVLVLTLWSIAIWKLAGPTRAAWSTFILATSVMVIGAAKACLTDAVLLLFITTAHLCLYAVYRGRRDWWIIILMGVSIGLAGLTKGPVVLAVMGTTLAGLAFLRMFGRPAHAIKPVAVDLEKQFLGSFGKTILVLALVVGIVGPWLWAINRYEPSFLPRIIGHDVVKRMKTGLEGHSAPPGYHLLTIWGVFFPWAIFLPLTVIFAWKRRHLPIIRFALATVLGCWVFFELVSTKLPHYLLPIYPWLALLMADALIRCLRGLADDFDRPFTINALSVWGAVPILGGLVTLWWYKTVPTLATAAWVVATLVVGLAVIFCFRARRPQLGLLTLGLGNFLLVAVLFGLYLPNASRVRASILVADELKKLGATGPNAVWMMDYKEPSLAFYQGGTIRENSNLVITPALVEKAPPFLVITNEVWKNTDPAVQALYEVKATVPALAYADRMRRLDVMIVKKIQ